MAQHEGTFERAAAGSLAALGGDPADDALDLWADPSGAAEALGALGDRGIALLRAAPDLGGGEQGFAPDPAAPWWVRITRGSPEIRACPSLGEGDPACETRRVTRVVVESTSLPDSADGAVARVSLTLERSPGALGNKVLVAEAWARDEETAAGRVRAAAGRLARVLSVAASLPASGPASGTAADPAADPASNTATATAEAEPPGTAGAAPLPARALARFSLRSEGPRIVLRDFASRGPREKVGVHLLVGLGFTAAAATAWAMFARNTATAGFGAQGSIAWLGGSVLLTLAAVAFLGVARFARRYAAASAPLVSLGAGKVVVAPWVSRKGAVGLEMEGRFGAGIELGEVRGVSVQPRKGLHAIELATDHGPMDALLTDDAAVARYLTAALARVADDLRPRTAPNARQRARARAAT